MGALESFPELDWIFMPEVFPEVIRKNPEYAYEDGRMGGGFLTLTLKEYQFACVE